MRKKKKKKLVFGINAIDGNRDWLIHEGSPEGPAYTIEQVQHELESGNVDILECTWAFGRLIELNWDMDALKHEFDVSIDDQVGAINEAILIVDDILKDIIRSAEKYNPERN